MEEEPVTHTPDGERRVRPKTAHHEPAPQRREVGSAGRWASAVAGAASLAAGLRRGGTAGVLLVAGGGELLLRAVTGRGSLQRILEAGGGTRPLSPVVSVRHDEGVKVERSFTVNRPAQELYRFWRELENLPRFMKHLESVRVLDGGRSLWVARGPAGTKYQWEAEIHNERPGELLAWRSVEGADVPNAGSVQFRTAPGGRGTEVRVVLEYEPPAGELGRLAAKLFGQDPDAQVREDLRRFKQVVEAGEIPTSDLRRGGSPPPHLADPEPARTDAS